MFQALAVKKGAVVRDNAEVVSIEKRPDLVIDSLVGEFGQDVVVGPGSQSGHGFKMGPAVGRILAGMAIDGKANMAAEAGVELGYFRIRRGTNVQ
ncbi:hypothetical protein BAE44_0009817 [Dichanthelium oligosanthes]|uniref:FAD dependent oxidoreductase domain-containing protein n=1 Tax=Dichanthelium oligosanthes TaxID=888268 RepID=A0A1E5VVR6_9POAL|nr:hypothetical protein BAE44_0009817 [Dichanthelium oligosanthes]